MDKDLLQDLSMEYGDSFYLLHSDVFRNNYSDMLNAFRKLYHSTEIAYSYKTNYTPTLCRIINESGGNAEIVSEMEMWLAEKIGVSAGHIFYNGPYKKEEFVEKLMLGGGHINLDGAYEVSMVQRIAAHHPDRKFKVGIRCALDIGQEVPTRFGFDVSSGDMRKALETLNGIANVSVSGMHCHIPFRSLDTFEKRMNSLKTVLEEFSGYSWEYISLGGGYMGPVSEQLASQMDVKPPTYDDYARVIAGGMNTIFSDTVNKPILIIEPGSALAANAMQYVTKVINIKSSRNKDIATLSGSTYQMNPSVRNVNRPIKVYHFSDEEKCYKNMDLAGYTCIESDYLYKGYSGELAVGDYVVFDNVGSYSVVMKPPFILPDIPMLEIHSDDSYEVVKRAQRSDEVFAYFN